MSFFFFLTTKIQVVLGQTYLSRKRCKTILTSTLGNVILISHSKLGKQITEVL